MKKCLFAIVLTFSLFPVYSQGALRSLCLAAMDNNSDIQAAENNWKNAEFSRKSAGGAFVPSVSISSSAILPNEYEWKTCPDGFSSSLTYSQPLPGGSALGISGTYSYTAAQLGEECFITQTPQLAFTLTQSLFPFWLQGKLQDPSVLSVKNQSEYYYNQLLYTRQTVIQNIIQNYISAYSDSCKIQIYENYILQVQNQINAFSQMEKIGNANNAQILELQSKKWSYQQDLMSVLQDRESYIQSLEVLCGMNISADDIDGKFFVDDVSAEDFCIFINELCGGKVDPCEKALLANIQTLTTSVTSARQSAAPVVNFSVTPAWALDTTKVENWRDAWDSDSDGTTTDNWTIGIVFDLSPIFSEAANKNIKKASIELEQANKNLVAYQKQKTYVHQQYEKMFIFLKEQRTTAKEIYLESENQFNELSIQFVSGAVSKQDYDSMEIQMKNNFLALSCLDAMIWLYKVELMLP